MIKKKKAAIVSGYWNPLHGGHIHLFKEAKKLADYLIVIVNNDDQVKIKGAVPFLDEKDRVEIISSLRMVDKVLLAVDQDKTVCDTLKCISEAYSKGYEELELLFCNGGDRKSTKDIPEVKVCREEGIKMIFNVGGEKIQSSSWLIKKAVEHGKERSNAGNK